MQPENDIAAELKEASSQSFTKKDFDSYYKLFGYIIVGLKDASDAYITIACNLWQIYYSGYYRIDNYKSIVEFAFDNFEFKKGTTYNYIKVIDRFGDIKAGKVLGIKEKFMPFRYSQLVAMLPLTPQQLEKVKPDWTVRRINALRKSGESAAALEAAEADEEESLDSELEELLELPDVEIESGRITLMEFTDIKDFVKNQESFLSAYNDMKKDKNFKNKKIRFILELAYD